MHRGERPRKKEREKNKTQVTAKGSILALTLVPSMKTSEQLSELWPRGSSQGQIILPYSLDHLLSSSGCLSRESTACPPCVLPVPLCRRASLGKLQGNKSEKETRNLIKSRRDEQSVSLGAGMRVGHMRMENRAEAGSQARARAKKRSQDSKESTML